MKTIKQSVALAILASCIPSAGCVLAAGEQHIQHTSTQLSRSGKASADATEMQANVGQSSPVLPELPVPPALNPSYAWYAPPVNAAQAAETTEVPQTAPVIVPPPKKPAPVVYIPPVAAAPEPPLPASNTPMGIQNIDFRREPDGSGRVIITLPDGQSKVSDDKRGNTVTISIPDMDVPANLQKRMDVGDFGTPVDAIDVSQRDLGTRIRISAHEGFTYDTQRNGNEYTVVINKIKAPPIEQAANPQKDKKAFTGEKLSLNFQDIEVRAVLQLLADFTNKNIVVSDTVQGNITVRLKDVPWDQALDIVLESKNLAMRENGNVIWVAPATEMDAKEKQQLEAIKSKQALEPLVSEAIRLNYAKAADMAALMKSTNSGSSGSADSSQPDTAAASNRTGSFTNMLSNRGSVSFDDRTNTLLVQDTASNMQGIREMIKLLDVPVEQVLIESRIVTASDGFSKDLGARFGITPKISSGNSVGIGVGHLGSGTDDYFTSMAAAALDDTGKTLATLPGLTDRLSVNLPVTGAAGSFGFSILSSDFMVDLELSALQAENNGEIISTPKVITSNQTKALIEQGVEIPYLQASSSGATNVAFKKAVLSLEVTPQITPDEHISMDLKVNQDTVGSIYSGVPSINTREVQTKVLVDNGQTVVLGGVHEEENINGVTKVPVLGDVPILGHLFRSTNRSNDKRELLIFVTPKIVDSKS
jgi:type IV pilus assembly protein PilQ